MNVTSSQLGAFQETVMFFLSVKPHRFAGPPSDRPAVVYASLLPL